VRMLFALGSWVLRIFNATSEFFGVWGSLGRALLRYRPKGRAVASQIQFMANESLFMVCFCVSFAAVVTVLESSFHMKLVIQNDSLVPGFSSLLILRELAVVVMALLLASRVGAGMAAEMATMKVTEQIDALKLLGLQPIPYLVVPRFLAAVFAGVVLTVFANMVCLFGAMVVSVSHLGFTAEGFWTATQTFVKFSDLIFAMIKGAVFGAIIPVVACYSGFRCEGGADGVGTATTHAVVLSSILIIFSDFALTSLFSQFY
jgi:phospholipid/cholesterol/gamma-HCH transport system permease protein